MEIMKKSILIIVTVAFSILSMNATILNKNLNTSYSASVAIEKEDFIEIYEWTVKTNKGNYAGTAFSLEEAQKMVRLSTSGEIITDLKIESFFVLKSELNQKEARIYYWEVISSNGKAKVTTTSEHNAKRMIELVASGDIITYKIIKSNRL